MMTRITAMAALALLAACDSASVPEGEAAAQTRSAAKPLTIAGVRIGMSATDVQATLARDGWKLETFPGRDWATTVDAERRQQRGASAFDLPRNGIETIRGSKADETLVVELRPMPDGAAVRHVAYEAPIAGRTADEIRVQVIERYGQPDVAAAAPGPLDMTWCSGGERCRNASGAMKPALNVKEDVYHKLRMGLSDGVDAERAWRNAVQRASGIGAPAKSSF